MDQDGRGSFLTATDTGDVTLGVSTAARLETSCLMTDESAPDTEDGAVFVDLRARRADVVGRLLDMGVTPRTLTTLLPEWERLIDTVATRRME